MKTVNDPENYMKMCAPIDGVDAANEKLEAFYEDVREARNRHGIADVTVVVCMTVKDGGNCNLVLAHAHNGDSARTEEMLAAALGRERVYRQGYVENLAKGKRTKKA